MLDGITVLDHSTGIAGGYCTKMLADAGASVIKVEPEVGDPLRRFGSGGLFDHLHQAASIVAAADAGVVPDVFVTSDAAEARAWHERRPEMVVVSITPFGADGPWAGRPATESTLQAACGSTGNRGLPEQPPLPAGGQLGEWIAGTYAAYAAVSAIGIGAASPGRWVDVAMLDCMTVTLITYPSVFASFLGWPPMAGTGRTVEVPSIAPTADGYVCFTTNSAQQFQDFSLLVGKPEWMDDPKLARAPERFARRDEFLAGVHAWSTTRTTAQALEEAAELRIPAGPVLDGSTVGDFEPFVARGVYRRSPDGRFRQPRVPYRITPAAAVPAEIEPVRPTGDRPLAGVRVLDCTAWWAGPCTSHALASMGADVIKVESPRRPDLMRTMAVRPPTEDHWYEWGPIFHAMNASKRGITIDLTRPEGVELFERLARTADVIVENNTPRVMEQFGLGWDRLQAVNPRLVMVRMPAFGLDGPWRDRTGFAQTMESVSGMASVTGFADGPPVLPRGACDPLGGIHAAFAAVLALRARERDGRGRLVEATMVEAALNVTVAQIIEWDAAGVLLGRHGTQGDARIEDVFACAGDDAWVAVAVTSDAEEDALQRLLGGVALAEWCATRGAHEAAETLVAQGIPAAAVIAARDVAANPQLLHRGLFEPEDHPVTGRHDLPTFPVRMSGIAAWTTRPSPTIGEHNDEVLAEVATPDEIAALRSAGVVGEQWVTG